MVSQTSPSFSTEDLIILPVKSFFAHRVITTIMDPPGWRRWRGPDEYHS